MAIIRHGELPLEPRDEHHEPELHENELPLEPRDEHHEPELHENELPLELRGEHQVYGLLKVKATYNTSSPVNSIKKY